MGPGAARVRAVGVAPFLGRQRELAEIVTLFGRSRLVTLTGPPGIGKTRLALECASRHCRDAALVELAPIGDPAAVARTLAGALSIQEAPDRSVADTLVAHLVRRPRLLVIDNCEHLVDACGQLVATLLDGCPQLTILTTSREPLGVGGERVWPVPPLSLPDDTSHERLTDYDAIGLFVERARAAQPGFALNSYVVAPVTEICRRLDGIALAIELAAARVQMLTPAEIARRLDDRFALLTDGHPGDVARHHTLQAALDWSHELLCEGERVVLRRLSVFAGGFSLEAAEAVCSGDGVERSEVGDLLAALGSKSLLLTGEDGSYGLLETVRAYGADRLADAGESAGRREAHARFHLALAERAERELTGPAQAGWLKRLDHDRQDMRAGIEWSLSQGRVGWALRLAGALVLFWRVRCHFAEGRELLQAALLAGPDEPPELRAKALWGTGFLAMMAGDLEDALPLLEHALEGFRALGDPRGSARALLILANCKQSCGGTGAGPLLEESIALAREAGDRWCLAHALGVAGFEAVRRSELAAARLYFDQCLAVARAAQDPQSLRIGLLGRGCLATTQGDYLLAEALLEEALQLADDAGEQYAAGTALVYLGELALGRGQYARARERLDRALALIPDPPGPPLDGLLVLAAVARAVGDHALARRCLDEASKAGPGRPAILQAMGELAADEGDDLRALELFEEALDRARNAGAPLLTGAALHRLGHLAMARGDAAHAAALHGEALELQADLGVVPELAASLEAVAAVAGATDRHTHAARLFGAAHGLRTRGGYAHPPWESRRHETGLARSRRALSDRRFEAVFVEGTALSTAAAVALASEATRAGGHPATGWPNLTEREHEVAALVAQGLTNSEISARLFISLGSVKDHLSHTFSKLGIARRAQLAREVSLRERGPGGV